MFCGQGVAELRWVMIHLLFAIQSSRLALIDATLDDEAHEEDDLRRSISVPDQSAAGEGKKSVTRPCLTLFTPLSLQKTRVPQKRRPTLLLTACRPTLPRCVCSRTCLQTLPKKTQISSSH